MIAVLLQRVCEPLAPHRGVCIASAPFQRAYPHAGFVDALLDAVVWIPRQFGRRGKNVQRLFGLPQVDLYQRVGERDAWVFWVPRLAPLLSEAAGGFRVGSEVGVESSLTPALSPLIKGEQGY